jgi:beta-lactamase superfamily II metal-dependent hydrolase
MIDLILTMHPGSDGDALSLQWVEAGARRRAVIDLGRTADYRALKPWLVETSNIDLLLITHIDADHIEGAMPMVAEAQAPFIPNDVWFNNHDHLRAARERRQEHETLSVLQGEKLSKGIARYRWPWNQAFGGGPISTDSPEGAAPIDLHGLQITLLSPNDASLSALEKDWDKALRSAALRHGDKDEADATPDGLEVLSTLDVQALARRPFKPDRATPNGSSIAFVAQHGSRNVLMGADAHPAVLTARLRALGYRPDRRLKLDLFKLSHHGSKANLSPELLSLIDCTRFAISTDGTRHGFPDAEAISRILVADPDREKTLYFNFRQENARLWANATELSARWKYKVVMPDEGDSGLAINV